MRIERYQSRPKRGLSGCTFGLIIASLLIFMVVVFVLIAPAFPLIAMRLAGFEPISANNAQVTAESAPVIQNAQSATNITLSAGGFGSAILPASSAYTVQTGTAEDGSTIAQVTISEGGIQTLCAQYTDTCSSTSSTFRNLDVDLGTSTATISGEAYIDALNTWQPISALASLTADNRLDVQGVNINGTLFAVPNNEIGERIYEVENTLNQALAQLSLQADGSTFNLADITINDAQLVATFR